MEENGYETALRPFLKSCGNDTLKVNPKNYTKEQQALVKQKLNEISKAISDNDPAAAEKRNEAQGPRYLLRDRNVMNIEGFQLEGDNQADRCNKEVGDVTRLRPVSRGVLACISGGGRIKKFWDVFSAENPTQVCLNLKLPFWAMECICGWWWVGVVLEKKSHKKI